MSRVSDRPAARSGWPILLLGAAVLAALIASLLSDDPNVRTLSLTLFGLVPITQLSLALLRALRTGRVSATDRASQPAAYWSATFGLLLFILLLAAALVLALLD